MNKNLVVSKLARIRNQFKDVQATVEFNRNKLDTRVYDRIMNAFADAWNTFDRNSSKIRYNYNKSIKMHDKLAAKNK